MTKRELIKALEDADIGDDEVIVCADFQGGWDNIEKVGLSAIGMCAVIFGGGSPFSDE